MKKLSLITCAIALFGMCFTSCKPNNQGENQQGDYSNYLDGMYVFGDAIGVQPFADVVSSTSAMMGQGINEVDQTERPGMFEKYAILEGGKNFSLVLLDGQTVKYYKGDLVKNDSLPTDGGAVEGYQALNVVEVSEAANMQVEETGLYHILLDLNKDGNLDACGGAQIVVAPVVWGVSGAMNSWGWSEATTKPEIKAGAKELTWMWKDQDMAANGAFKFKDIAGWKLNLDIAELVKTNTNLGVDCKAGGADIAVEKAGLYDISLTFAMNTGATTVDYKYDIKLTQESSLPTTMYMIGEEFGSWDWNSNGVVELVPVHSHPGMFWCTRYIADAAKGFKFCAVKAWQGDFCQLTTNKGFTVNENNCFVAEAGLYTMIVNMKDMDLTIQPAEIFGMGDCFGGWDEKTHAFTINEDGTATITTTAEGNLRMYSNVNNDGNWWQSEFNVYEGNIVYRAGGGDQEAVHVAQGASITLNFNEGTGVIK